MTAIWHNSGGKWGLLGPVGFQEEAALHDLIEASPELLPLSGAPRLAVLGREVRLGTGAADLLAMEHDGRPVVIEIKLRANPEARRAVVAQVLAYAAYLYKTSFDELETVVLGAKLHQAGFSTIADAVTNLTQTEVDAAVLRSSVAGYLSSGQFRLVLVLDEIPPELARLVGYLEAIGPNILVDLISVSAYELGEDKVVVPQRVEPEKLRAPAEVVVKPPEPVSVPGAEDFIAAIEAAASESRQHLHRLADWAKSLASRGLATIGTTHGVRRKTLWVRVKGTDAGMVTIVTDYGGAIWLWPTVLARHAPAVLERLEAKLGSPLPVVKPEAIDDSLLADLTDAYEVAARNKSQASALTA